MDETANKKRRNVEFQEGDLVFLKLQPYRMKSLALRTNEKLAPKFFGPYAVVKRIGKVAYKLQLPDHSTIHPVFHLSHLKRALGNAEEALVQPLPPALTHELEFYVTPDSIQGVRRNEGTQELEVLVQWKDLPSFEQTWESYDTISRQFPEFHLEDKVKVWQGSIDRVGQFFGKKYQRRRQRMNNGEEQRLDEQRRNESEEQRRNEIEERAMFQSNGIGSPRSAMESVGSNHLTDPNREED